MSGSGELEPKDVLEVGAKALFGPVQDLFLKLTGPAAEEYGLMWGESVTIRRTKRLISGMTKTKRMLEEAGFEAQVVPDKLLLPIFEGISIEDNEDLHTMWAALLANAASSEGNETVRPNFVATLREMASDEAAVLNWIFDRVNPEGSENLPLEELFRDLTTLRADMTHLRICMEGLESAGLFSRLDTERRRMFVFDSNTGESNFTTGFPLKVTLRGVDFVSACRPPKRKE